MKFRYAKIQFASEMTRLIVVYRIREMMNCYISSAI